MDLVLSPIASPDILLATLNATYQHCAFGLRYLYANLKELQSRSRIHEFTIAQNPRDLAENILAQNPRIVGFGVYIWNTRQTEEVVSILKRVKPGIIIVLGGPEVSYELDGQKIGELADFVIKGEGELLFYELCKKVLENLPLPKEKLLIGKLPPVDQIALPYAFYNEEDIRNKVIYVEASRGCPYKCEFCLSSLDTSVRNFPLDAFLAEMEKLINKGVRQFKFVDRTFNLNIQFSQRILQFFLEQLQKPAAPQLFLHFEMIPDRLPEELREWIRLFPAGSLQFEIGIQTWNREVAKLISRRQDYDKVKENFRFLTKETEVHLHADLIVGLPGETLESFAKGFDAVYALKPHEIQVGILKRLKGTPIIRHDAPWEMLYQSETPFSILSTKTMPFATIQEMVRFAKFWDLYANSGNFTNAMEILERLSKQRTEPSLFAEFFDFSAFLNRRHPQRYAIALVNQAESFWLYLLQKEIPREEAREAIIQDFCVKIKREIPVFLRNQEELPRKKKSDPFFFTPERQRRHLNGSEASS